jgi:hypothetical protein
MSPDLNPLLQSWSFTPGQVTARKIRGVNGRELIQLRVDLGMLQMEVDGRPDGERPCGEESLFEYYKQRRDGLWEMGRRSGVFELDGEACARLQQEALQYYHRYLALFHLGDWPRVIRDTRRNLELASFIERYTGDPMVARPFVHVRPYLLLMLTRARANQALEAGDEERATRLIDEGIEEIKRTYLTDLRVEMMEQSEELAYLRRWKERLESTQPPTEKERLQRALEAAVSREDYEQAARLRDHLRGLQEA